MSVSGNDADGWRVELPPHALATVRYTAWSGVRTRSPPLPQKGGEGECAIAMSGFWRYGIVCDLRFPLPRREGGVPFGQMGVGSLTKRDFLKLTDLSRDGSI